MGLNKTIERARGTDVAQVISHASSEEKLAMAARAVFLIGAAITAASMSPEGVTTGAKIKYLLLIAIAVAATSAAMLALTNSYKFVRVVVHALDTVWLIALVLRSGGAASPLLYLLPLTIIPGGVFVAVEYGVITGMLLAIFTMYKMAESNMTAGDIFVYLFWASYYAFATTLMAALLAGKLARKNRIMYVESGKQNIFFEQRINKLERDLSEQKIADELTGLNNFRYFRARVNEEIQRADRYKYKFSVTAIGVDRLDEYEKKNGAPERDRIIVKAAQQLRKAVRDTDQLSRYTKDQFMVLLVSSDSKQSIIPARRIAGFIANVKAGAKEKETFPASFGIACYPDDAEDANSLISMAVAALEQSRERGVGKITLAAALYKRIIP